VPFVLADWGASTRIDTQLAIAVPYIVVANIENPTEVAGKAVLIGRGVALYSDKVQAAQDAGAVAVIIVNDDTSNPDAIASNFESGSSARNIPAVMISYNSGAYARAVGPGTSVVLSSGR